MLWGRWDSNAHCQRPKRCASAVGLRPLLILESPRECRSLRVAVRAEKAEVLLPVVEPVAVDVIHVQHYRLAVPFGFQAACLACVRHATLAQAAAQQVRLLSP